MDATVSRIREGRNDSNVHSWLLCFDEVQVGAVAFQEAGDNGLSKREKMFTYCSACTRKNFPIGWAGVAAKSLAGGDKKVVSHGEYEGRGYIWVEFHPTKYGADIVVPKKNFFIRVCNAEIVYAP